MSHQLCYRRVFGKRVCSEYKNKTGGSLGNYRRVYMVYTIHSLGNYRRIYAVYPIHTTTMFAIPVAKRKLPEQRAHKIPPLPAPPLHLH